MFLQGAVKQPSNVKFYYEMGDMFSVYCKEGIMYAYLI